LAHAFLVLWLALELNFSTNKIFSGCGEVANKTSVFAKPSMAVTVRGAILKPL
jgi:hypothetical protein